MNTNEFAIGRQFSRHYSYTAGNKPTAGKTYRVKFAERTVTARCDSVEYNERKERNAAGKLIPLAGWYATFTIIG